MAVERIRPIAELRPTYWDYFAQTVSRVTRGSMEQLREILDSPWLQQEVRGEKRIIRLMRVGSLKGYGTILHAAVRTRNIEKITEILREDRGGRQAFLVYQTDDKGYTPLHRAAAIYKNSEIPILNLLLENGGDAAKFVKSKNGRYPEELTLRRAIADLLSRGFPPGPDVAAEPPFEQWMPNYAAPSAEILAYELAVINWEAQLAPIPAGGVLVHEENGPPHPMAPDVEGDEEEAPAAEPPAAPAEPPAAEPPAAPAAEPPAAPAEPPAAEPPAAPAAPAEPPAAPAAEPPAAPAAEPPAAEPPAAPAHVLGTLGPPPPAREFVPIQVLPGLGRNSAYRVHIYAFQEAFAAGAPASKVDELLRSNFLHQERNGVRRIQNLMRFVFHHLNGTILHMALNARVSLDKLKLLLQPWTGARKAFLIVDESLRTPMRIAAAKYRDERVIQYLLDNGGKSKSSLLVEDATGRLPVDVASNGRVRAVLQAAVAEVIDEPPAPLADTRVFFPEDEDEPQAAAPEDPLAFLQQIAAASNNEGPNPYPAYQEPIVPGERPVKDQVYNDATVVYDPMELDDVPIAGALEDTDTALVVKTGDRYSRLFREGTYSNIKDGFLVRFGCKKELIGVARPPDIYGRNPFVLVTGLASGNFLVLLAELQQVLQNNDVRAIELVDTGVEFQNVTGVNGIVRPASYTTYLNQQVNIASGDHCQENTNRKIYTITILNLQKEEAPAAAPVAPAAPEAPAEPPAGQQGGRHKTYRKKQKGKTQKRKLH